MRHSIPLIAILFAALAGIAPAHAGTPSEATAREINQLFGYLEGSGCEFNRNGSWYNAKEATNHLRKKYQYLIDKQMVDTTEQFIERAATQSSMSGKPYEVRCAGQAAQASAQWFSAELKRLRGAKN